MSDLIPPSRPTALLVLLALVAFGLQLGGEFIWDDTVLVVDNRLTGDWRNLPRFFTVSLWETTGVVDPERTFYRPLMLVELWLDRALIDPPAAWLHRLHNLLWHLAGCLLFFRLLQRLRPGAWLAFPAAALYALHPLQTEVVAFTAARNDAMAGALMCAALLVLQPVRAGSLRLVAGASLFAAALLSKEVALACPAVLLGLDWLRHGRPTGWARHGVLAAVVGAWVGLRLALQLQVSPAVPQDAFTWLSHSAAVLLAPWTTSPTAYLAALSPRPVPLVGVVLALAAVTWRGGRQAWIGLFWFAATLALCVPAVAHTDQMPYRYLSVPLAGLALALHAAWPEGVRPRVGVLLATGLAALTLAEAPQWQDSTALWLRGHALGPCPRSACGVFKTIEDTPEAEPWLAEALAPPPAQYCCYSATRWYLDRGDPAGALAAGQTALARGCNESPELLAPLAIAEAIAGRWAEAEGHASTALPDPTGLAPVVLSAAALRRGDRTVLEHWDAQAPGGSQRPLQEQVDWLLGASGE